jgi:hypothetical protein
MASHAVKIGTASFKGAIAEVARACDRADDTSNERAQKDREFRSVVSATSIQVEAAARLWTINQRAKFTANGTSSVPNAVGRRTRDGRFGRT